MKAVVSGPDGKPSMPIHGGSYGVGVSRLVGAIIEASHDDAGIIWPEPVAPFDVAMINLKAGDAKVDAACEDLYAKLTKSGRACSTTTPLNAPAPNSPVMDLIGIPYQLIVGPRGLDKGQIEVKTRKTGAREEMSPDAAVNRFSQ